MEEEYFDTSFDALYKRAQQGRNTHPFYATRIEGGFLYLNVRPTSDRFRKVTPEELAEKNFPHVESNIFSYGHDFVCYRRTDRAEGFFNMLCITRNEACQQLIPYVQEPTLAKRLWPAISEALKFQDFFEYLKEEFNISLADTFEECQSQTDIYKRTQHLPEVIRAYLMYAVKEGRQVNGWLHVATLRLIADCNGFDLQVWKFDQYKDLSLLKKGQEEAEQLPMSKSMISKRKKKINVVFLQGEDFCKNEFAQIEFLNLCWKVHISLLNIDDNIKKAWDLIVDLLVVYGVGSCKVLVPGNNFPAYQWGKEITVYCIPESIDWEALLNDIAHRFFQAGIKPNYIAFNDEMIGTFFSFRNDEGVNGRYVSGVEAGGFNPSNQPIPPGLMRAKILSEQPAVRTRSVKILNFYQELENSIAKTSEKLLGILIDFFGRLINVPPAYPLWKQDEKIIDQRFSMLGEDFRNVLKVQVNILRVNYELLFKDVSGYTDAELLRIKKEYVEQFSEIIKFATSAVESMKKQYSETVFVTPESSPKDSPREEAIEDSSIDKSMKSSESDVYEKLSYAIQEEWDRGGLEKAIEASLNDNENLRELRAVLLLQAITFGFKVKEIKRDGNCFFHSASDQLQEIGFPNSENFTAEYLRQCVTQHLIDYAHLYTGSVDGGMDEFIAKMSEAGEWADSIIIHALSRIFNVTLVLIRSDGREPTVFRRANPVGILYLGYEVGLHFQSLITDKGIKPEKNIKSFIEQAQIDDFNEPVKLPEFLYSQSIRKMDESDVKSEDKERFFDGSPEAKMREGSVASFLESQSSSFSGSVVYPAKNSASEKFDGTLDGNSELNFDQWISRDSVAILLPLIVRKGNSRVMTFCALDGGIGVAAYSSQIRAAVQEARRTERSLFVISKEPVGFASQHYVLTIFHKERIYFIDPTGQVRNGFCKEFNTLFTDFFDMKSVPLLASRTKLQHDPEVGGLVSCGVICLALCEFFSEEKNLKRLEEVKDEFETKKALTEDNTNFMYNDFDLSKLFSVLVPPAAENYRSCLVAYRAKLYALLNVLDEPQLEKFRESDRELLELIQRVDIGKDEIAKRDGPGFN